MNTTSPLELLQRQGYVVPGDLVATASLVVLAWSTVFLPVVSETPVRVLFGPLLVLFLPGYAVLSALFPGIHGPAHIAPTARLDSVDRLLLSVVLSLALTVVVGMLLSVSAWGFTTTPMALGLGFITIAGCLAAAVRRGRLPPNERFSLPLSRSTASARAALVTAPRRTWLLNVLLVCGVVVAAGSIAYAAGAPQPTAPFSEFYLLSEGENTQPTTQGYDLEPGVETTFRVGIVNHERTTVDYTVVVVVQRLTVEDGVERVLSQTELDRLRLRVAAGDTREFDHTVSTDLSGSRVRVAYLLYKTDPPAFPTADSAYRGVFVSVDPRTA